MVQIFAVTTVGVGYRWHFLGNILRLSTFIFFSLTLVIVITNPKKFLKNIAFKKFPSHFTNLEAEMTDFKPKIPRKTL